MASWWREDKKFINRTVGWYPTPISGNHTYISWLYSAGYMGRRIVPDFQRLGCL
jgi:hypothetical protein